MFHTQHRELHEAVVDYISYFLHRRKALDAETTVEQIRCHCERATGQRIPLDYFIGAMLYCGYRVEYVGERHVAGIAKASPLKNIFRGKVDKNKPEFETIRKRYGDDALSKEAL
mgnify:FL=1